MTDPLEKAERAILHERSIPRADGLSSGSVTVSAESLRRFREAMLETALAFIPEERHGEFRQELARRLAR